MKGNPALVNQFTEWQNKPVTILGLSLTGMAVVDYLRQRGANCFVSEMLPASPANEKQRKQLDEWNIPYECGAHTLKCFEHADLVVASPGIPPHAGVMKELRLSGKTIISEIELAWQEAQCPIVAITGTNGKTTTTLLTHELLEATGESAPACGNIGLPIIECVLPKTDPRPSNLVAEVSSYQLQLTQKFKADIAIFTNFRPDHLEWHGSLDAYKQAKSKLFLEQQAPNWAILNFDDPVCQEVGQATTSKVLWFSRNPQILTTAENAISIEDGFVKIKLGSKPAERLFEVTTFKLPGKHNLENMLCAVGGAYLKGINIEAIKTVLAQFKGAQHRLEKVPSNNGIAYFNDSKATNVDAVLCALEAFEPKSVILIAGGRDKMTPLEPFVDGANQYCNTVILIGEAADRFSLALNDGGFKTIHKVQNLEQALKLATDLATEKTPVVLSPACASFDQYPNFEARGDHFKALVKALSPVAAVGA